MSSCTSDTGWSWPSTPSKTWHQPSGTASTGTIRDRLDALVRLLPQLHHALAVRPVAEPGLRDDVPAQRLGDDVRRHLAPGEGVVGEVPERPLPRDRLVDDPDAVDLPDERRVGRRHDPAVDDQLAVEARPLTGPGAGSRSPARTGAPPGRSGCRRTGSSGRPAPSTWVARLTNARAAPAGIRTSSSSSGSGSSKSSSTWSGATTAASVNGKTSITTRASSGSHDRVIVPARNSSSIGCSSGSSSSRSSGATAGIVAAPPWLAITSSSSSSIRSARAATCCFSSATVTRWLPLRAWRKKVRCPGSPTVPVTKRSGGSNPWTRSHARHPMTEPEGACGPAPPPTAASRGALRRPRRGLAAPARTGRPRGC